MKIPRSLLDSSTLLRVSSGLVLVSLALMCWGILHPRPLPVIVAMSVGQGIGILGALIFLGVVLRDLRPMLRPNAAAKVEGPSQDQAHGDAKADVTRDAPPPST